MSRTLIASAITLAITTAAASPIVFSAPAGRGAFSTANTQVTPSRTALPGKSRAVRMSRQAMRQGRIQLNLGVGPDLEVVRERSVQRAEGRETWIGRVAGDPDSEVLLSTSGNAVAGVIRSHGRVFTLTPDGEGVQRLEEVDPSDPLPSTELLPAISADALGEGVATTTTGTGTTGETTIIDLLVAYTPQTLSRYGSQSGAEASIALAVEEANQAYLNSQAPVQLRLVGTVPVNYNDSGNPTTDLSYLTRTTDGNMDEIHQLRNELGADLVSLVVDTGSVCGVSWQLGVLDPGSASNGFNVVKTTCLNGYYSLAHEIGHNLGLSHDHANATSGLFPYSFGYQEPTSAFRTVMAYSCTSGCARVGHFSNPNVTYAGMPTGVADWADAALALDTTAPVVATWRASVMPFPPQAPMDLNASAISHERIDLTWGDLPDEEGYQVERSADGISFEPIASVAADSTGFSDTALTPETNYIYRLRAFNGAGMSDASNDAWATTLPAPITAPNAPTALQAAALSGSEILLAWSDLADNETAFEVERSSDNGGTWQIVASLPADTQDFTDTNLVSVTSYQYRVRALNAAASSGYSNIASATTAANCSATGATSLTLSGRYTAWNLTNTAGNDLTISAVELIWTKSQGNLTKLSLNGSAFWSGKVVPTSANLTSGWTSTTARVLNSGSTETLKFDFGSSYYNDKQTDYRIVVRFAEGCSVSF